jgi:plastocyanin
MKKALRLILSLAVLSGFALPTFGLAATTTALAAPVQAVSPHTYTVLVGAEDMARGVEVNVFFPSELHIHVGDTVVWKANTMEIHTVTFLAGQPLPELIIPAPPNPTGSPLMLNPLAAFPQVPADGMYDGSTYVNSALMSTDPGQVSTFSLTFIKPGTYAYVCIVHGTAMSGSIVVEDPNVVVPSPTDVLAQAMKQIADERNLFPQVLQSARAQEERPTLNPDGSLTFHVLVGFSSGNIDIHKFFPDKLRVAPGDSVEFKLSKEDMAPHTVTFLNGAASPEDFIVVPQPPPAPPLIVLNPQVLFPANPGVPLTNQGIFNSGLMAPGTPNTSFTFPVGHFTGILPFECLLHDEMGMDGNLIVTPRPNMPPGLMPVLGPNGDPLLFMALVQS